MKNPGVHLQYSFDPSGQLGAEVSNPLFDLLQALRTHGSIQHAAKQMGASYRHVWGALKHWQKVLDEPLVTWSQGQPARLTPFAERLLWAETRARARLTPHIEALRAELEHVWAQAHDATQHVLSIHASHDLTLPQLREQAAREHGLHIELKFTGSMDALRALAEGRCLIAGFHVPLLTDNAQTFARVLKPLLKPGHHKLIGCMRRVQGLMVARGNPLRLRDLTDLADRPLRFVQRQPGSGTRLLTDYLLKRQGIESPAWQSEPVAEEESHIAVAASIASGVADAGVGIEAAARAFGLGFVPLLEEDYFLVCLAHTLEHPAVCRLREALADRRFNDLLDEVAGYSPSHGGEVLSLTRALPWWNFKRAKAAAPSDTGQRKVAADGASGLPFREITDGQR